MYVGMSSDSMGFKGGFDSSWQDKWPSSVGDDNKRFSSLRSSTNNNQPNVADAKTNNAAASIVGDKKPQKAGLKARKPIDLGAAANFAQQSTHSSTRQAGKSSVSNTIDLFGTDGGETTHSTPQQPSSLVITGDDDFDPRGSSSTGLSNTSASNGNFGFGNPVNKTDADDSDFADFSSAFGGPSSDSNKTNIDQNLFKTDSAIPAPPSPQGASADVDLFGISSNNSNTATNGNNSSGLGDLLGGLSSGSDNLTSMPNLMSAPQMSSSQGVQQPSLFGDSLAGIGSASNTSLPPLQPTSTLNLFQPNPSALINSPILATGQTFGAGSDVSSSTHGSVDQERKSAKLPSTWNDVKGLNMDLANFSLSNPTQKKAAMSMNAMKMSQSSSKSSSPLSPMGKGGFPAPAAPNLKPQAGSFDLL